MSNSLPPDIDPSKALLLEAIGGLLMLPGLGWIYAGDTLRGAVILLGSLIGVAPLVVETAGLTAGLGLFCCMPPIYMGLALDVLALQRWFRNPQPYTWRRLIIENVLITAALVILLVADLVALTGMIYWIGRTNAWW